ncbi:MAG: Rv2578c family radical SAM protein [Nocardiopsaceae bacterium]|nr:Rv2578c family radical SAM protein [Nocardiopsaceae bacterium]
MDMRWDNLRLDDSPEGCRGAEAPASGAQLPLFARGAVTRTFDTPGFRGMTFYEIQAKSIVSRVPASSRMPFTWTINPYRGCQHSCIYCYARQSHTYLDMDAGHDFDSKVIVKVNAPELLRAKLASPGWRGEHIAMGTNVDCYQRAEGRYRLMRGIIGALRDAANPFSILTKGTLILRDLDLLGDAAEVTSVGLNVSAGFTDTSLWRSLEPGTPAPERRLEVCARLNDSGLPCGVMMGPVVPFLSDSPAQLDAAVRRMAEAGATHVSPIVLHLRPGTREWFMSWLRAEHPELGGRYAALYRGGSYARREYQENIAARVRELADRYGIGRRPGTGTRGARGVTAPRGTRGVLGGRGTPASGTPASGIPAVAAPPSEQLTLL